MDLNRAAIFVRVVAEGGFTAAAKALHLPKSSVSRAVSLLEEELGVRLLQRSTRKVHLTEAGATFYTAAAAGIGSMQDAAAAVTDLQAGLRGTIRITAPLDAGTWMLAPLIARFIALHPGVYIDVLLTGRVVDLVSEGIDFGLRVTSALRDSTLVARKLGRIAVGLYAAPAYLTRKGSPAAVADLHAHQCVLFRPDRGRATWRLDGPDGVEEIEVKGVAAADDFFFVQRMLLEGAGIGLLPSFLCDAAVDSGALVRVLPDHGAQGGQFHLAYPTTRHLPHRCAVFRDFIVEALGERDSRGK